MPQTTVRTALGANGTANPFANTQYEYLNYPAFVELGVLADATGVLGTFQTGSDVVQEEGPVPIGTINVAPTYPDNFTLNDVVGPGERINWKLRDTSGAARVVMTTLKITPL